ncbi:hypothetical protein [Stenotrophomonas sp. B2]|uniref:hypothetical protein n=1 Tax=Stenotrophomonas sp. B2 TaxID=1537778 RepID=UPI0018769063|nr:hypothetical protein [Stenotrophomonas sp. B2]MBE5270578.1 hypothetical protein [Stenotrophomonas sp. B2]
MAEATEGNLLGQVTPSTRYLESMSRHEFMEVHEDKGCLRVRLGKIGRPCLVVHASFNAVGKAQEVQRHLAETLLTRGYVECEGGAEIVEGSVVDELYCDGRVPHPLLDAFFEVIGADELRGRPQRLAWFRNGLSWHEDFEFERLADLGLHVGVIVEGNVEIDGVLSQLTFDYPEFILVSGDVSAKSFGHRDSSMRVLGDVRVENIVYGEYNGGSLCIEGSVYGRAFISDDHYMYAAGGYHLLVIRDGENWEYLVPELFEDDEDEYPSLSEEAIRQFMREGKDPLVPGAIPTYRELSSAVSLAHVVVAPPVSEFEMQLRQFWNDADAEGVSAFIENWPVRNGEWLAGLAGRLYAPSTTLEQRERLLAVARSLDPSSDLREQWTALMQEVNAGLAFPQKSPVAPGHARRA